MRHLTIQAGKNAYKKIQTDGFVPSIITSVFGASGAAKWLGIYGLDRAIFSEWFTAADKPRHLFGTSVGAWKLAAAAQANPGEALDKFATAYIDQHYGNDTSHDAIIRETKKILDSFLSDKAIDEILNNPHFYYHCGAVRSLGLFASENKLLLALALGLLSVKNLAGRKHLRNSMKRVVFSDPRHATPLTSHSLFINEERTLTAANFCDALRASGAIPYLMPGITEIGDAPSGMYRDGGLLDYHPCPNGLWSKQETILYPHFYPYLVPGWFDKSLKQRRATPSQLDNVILISPSPEYVDSLPFKKLPDRNDFKIFYQRDEERKQIWRKAAEMSRALGEEFLNLANTDCLVQEVTLIR